MARQVKLVGEAQRDYAKSLVSSCPDGWIVSFREPTRTLDQNAALWAMLTDLSKQKPMGIVETADGWKMLVMHAAGHECQFMQGLDGRPFPVGFRSSRMSVKQMSDLISWVRAFGDENGIKWSDPGPYERSQK